MKHSVPAQSLGPRGAEMAEAVQACVHCGFCLPSCPTYRELGQEMDSPRGRILLMKEVLEGELDAEEALPHVDRCLGCLACETSCPSGVRYRDLVTPFRDHVESSRKRGLLETLRRALVAQTLPYPARFRLAARLGNLGRPFAERLPKTLRPMLELLPRRLPKRERLPRLVPAQGVRKARVALLAGCAQQALRPQINRATLSVLSRNGVEIVVPRAQACCGSLAWHVGNGRQASRFARQNLDAFPGDVDAIVVNAAGCGSGMREYPTILKGTDFEPRAAAFADKVVDVSAFLHRLGIATPPAPARPLRIAYHDACHLGHGQGVWQAPRDLLQSVPDIQILDLPDRDICCGSAGTYNIDQPDIAARLGERKAQAIQTLQPDWVATGNIGCLTQLQTHLAKTPHPPRVAHTVELLEAAYCGELA